MRLFVDFIAELACLAIVPGAFLFTLLVLRNPHNPSWMKSEMVAQTASLLLVGLFSAAIAWVLTVMTSDGIHFVTASVISVATLATSGGLVWFAFDVGERLRCADAGHSPFGQTRMDVPRTGSKKTAH